MLFTQWLQVKTNWMNLYLTLDVSVLHKLDHLLILLINSPSDTEPIFTPEPTTRRGMMLLFYKAHHFIFISSECCTNTD